MGTVSSEPSHGDEGVAGTGTPPRVPLPATPGSAEAPRLTYQVILRHLAKFRDGAHAVLDIFDSHQPEHALSGETVQPWAEPVETEPKTPLQLRIERHMASVDRALVQIRDLNPDHKKKVELPPEIRQQILTKERTLRDIVGAELHFWSAAIENAPLDKFDEIEQKWIRRMIRLAGILGVDAEHKEHLDFLQDWASQEHA